MRIDPLRSLLVSVAKEAAFRKVIMATMVRDRQHGPVVELNRVSQAGTAVAKKGKKLSSSNNINSVYKTVFEQMVAKMDLLRPDSLLLPHRAWKVKFVGQYVRLCTKANLPYLRSLNMLEICLYTFLRRECGRLRRRLQREPGRDVRRVTGQRQLFTSSAAYAQRPGGGWD